MKNRTDAHRLALSAMLLAAAYVLPFFTGQLRGIGKMLCPMHLPVLLCGFLCGWQWALAVGLTAPILRSLTLGMPAFFPSAVCMSAELAAYGVIVALCYRAFPKKRGFIYLALVAAMIGGRLVWGAARLLAAGISATPFGFAAFWAGAVTESLPGIAVQLVLVPILVILCKRES